MEREKSFSEEYRYILTTVEHFRESPPIEGRIDTNGVYDHWHGIQFTLRKEPKELRKTQIAQVAKTVEMVMKKKEGLKHFACKMTINGEPLDLDMNIDDVKKGPFNDELRRLLRLHDEKRAQVAVVFALPDEIDQPHQIRRGMIDRIFNS